MEVYTVGVTTQVMLGLQTAVLMFTEYTHVLKNKQTFRIYI